MFLLIKTEFLLNILLDDGKKFLFLLKCHVSAFKLLHSLALVVSIKRERENKKIVSDNSFSRSCVFIIVTTIAVSRAQLTRLLSNKMRNKNYFLSVIR